LIYEFNNTHPLDLEKRNDLIHKIFKNIEGTCIVESPFNANWRGKNVTLKNGVY